MPLCELSVGANPEKFYKVGSGVQLWTWSPVSANAFNMANNSVKKPSEDTSSSQQVDSFTRVIESSSDLTDVLKSFPQTPVWQKLLVQAARQACP